MKCCRRPAARRRKRCATAQATSSFSARVVRWGRPSRAWRRELPPRSATADGSSPCRDSRRQMWYASSALGRERVIEFYSSRYGTLASIVRLNYAIDLRYGVLADIALRVWRNEPVPVAMGYVNVIWQGDASRIAIESLALAATPPFVVNVTGMKTLSVRAIADAFGDAFGKPVRFKGKERADALLSNTG